MFCHSCGKEIGNSVKFCPFCGAKSFVERSKEPEVKAQMMESKSAESEYFLPEDFNIFIVAITVVCVLLLAYAFMIAK